MQRTTQAERTNGQCPDIVADGDRGVAPWADSSSMSGAGRGAWRGWVAPAAGIWSLMYAALGTYWTLGGAGFPFGPSDPGSHFSVFAGVQVGSGAPVIAILGLLGTAVAVAMVGGVGHGLRRVGLLSFAWIAAVVLLLVVPDARALVAVAYAPVFVIGSLLGRLPGDYRDAIPWPVLNQFVCLVGGFLWVAAALAYRQTDLIRARVGGVTPSVADWTAPAVAAGWGRWATFVAASVPLLYAVTRWAWALGIPLGIDSRFLQAAHASGDGARAGAALGTMAIAGSLLTLGLIREWGERFPAWLPLLGGRSVPVALAIVPAGLVAVLVTEAGLMFWRRSLLGIGRFSLGVENWAALWPELLWPVWGVALGAATLAYYYRRRGGRVRPAAGPSGRVQAGSLV